MQRYSTSSSALFILHFRHAAHKLLGILDVCVDFVLLEHLSVLGQILLVHFLDFSLKLFFFFVQHLHVDANKLLDVQLVIASTA